MSKLIFKAAEVKRIVEHTLAAPKQMDDYGGPVTVPSIKLVHDQGVYLMSNGTPRDIVKGESSYIAFAKGCDPVKDEETWWDHSRDLVGGDDFAETLAWAKPILDAINRGAKTITFNFGASKISFSCK